MAFCCRPGFRAFPLHHFAAIPMLEKKSQRPRNQLFHDLIGSRVDTLRTTVDPHAGYRILHHVSVTAMQLHALIDDTALALGEPVLRHRGRRIVQLACNEALDATVEKDAADMGFRHALSQLKARILKVNEGFAGSGALLDITACDS